MYLDVRVRLDGEVVEQELIITITNSNYPTIKVTVKGKKSLQIYYSGTPLSCVEAIGIL